MTRQRHENSRNFTINTRTGSGITKNWSDQAEERQNQLEADIDAFLQAGGSVEEVPTIEGDHHLSLITNHLLDNETPNSNEPKYIEREYCPVAVHQKGHLDD